MQQMTNDRKQSTEKAALAAGDAERLSNPLNCNMQQIKTALLSFGMSGRLFHAPFITLDPGFRFYGVLERTNKVTATFYPGVKSYQTLEELLADREIELVVVNTPNYTHYDYAKKVLQAGKHVI